MKLVSVIIPAYKPQKFLMETIASAFGQTYKNLEIILVNDGSGDEFKHIFSEITALYPQLILLEVSPNKGVAAARNLGAQKAKGEYLSFLDQDDIWKANKIELQSKYLDDNPEVGYMTSRQRYFLSGEAATWPTWVKPEHVDASLPGFLPGTLMVRANVFAKLGGFDATLKAGTDDVDWFFRAGNAGFKTCELQEEFLLKRIHGENLSSKTLQHNKELLSVVRMNMQRRKMAIGGGSGE